MEGHVIMKKNGIERWVPKARVEAKKAEGFEVVGAQPFSIGFDPAKPMPEPMPEPEPMPAARQTRVRGATEE